MVIKLAMVIVIAYLLILHHIMVMDTIIDHITEGHIMGRFIGGILIPGIPQGLIIIVVGVISVILTIIIAVSIAVATETLAVIEILVDNTDMAVGVGDTDNCFYFSKTVSSCEETVFCAQFSLTFYYFYDIIMCRISLILRLRNFS